MTQQIKKPQITWLLATLIMLLHPVLLHLMMLLLLPRLMLRSGVAKVSSELPGLPSGALPSALH